jgi:hypothetical protein
MAAYGSALEHTVRMQIVWFRKQAGKAEQAVLACRQLLRDQSGGDAPMASRVSSEEFDSSTDRQGASKKSKKKKKKALQFYAVAAGREIGGCSVGIFKTWREWGRPRCSAPRLGCITGSKCAPSSYRFSSTSSRCGGLIESGTRG